MPFTREGHTFDESMLQVSYWKSLDVNEASLAGMAKDPT